MIIVLNSTTHVMHASISCNIFKVLQNFSYRKNINLKKYIIFSNFIRKLGRKCCETSSRLDFKFQSMVHNGPLLWCIVHIILPLMQCIIYKFPLLITTLSLQVAKISQQALRKCMNCTLNKTIITINKQCYLLMLLQHNHSQR